MHSTYRSTVSQTWLLNSDFIRGATTPLWCKQAGQRLLVTITLNSQFAVLEFDSYHRRALENLRRDDKLIMKGWCAIDVQKFRDSKEDVGKSSVWQYRFTIYHVIISI